MSWKFNPFTGNLDAVSEETVKTDIDSLDDVTITTPADNEVVAYDNGSGEFINQTSAEAGLADASHNHTATDVTDFDTEVSNNTDVTANTTHRSSDGTDHSEVVTNVTHRGLTNNPHTVTATQVGAATTELDNLGTTAVNADIISDTDITDDLGSAAKRWAEVHTEKLFALKNPSAAGTVTQSNAGIMFGELAEVTSGASTLEASGKGSFASGYVKATGSGITSHITATKVGSFAFGAVKGRAGANYIKTGGTGSFTGGYVGSIVASHMINEGKGCFMWGYAGFPGVDNAYYGDRDLQTSIISIPSTGYGNFAVGWCGDAGGAGTSNKITSSKYGSFAFGLAYSYYGGNVEIKASGKGSFAGGQAYAYKYGVAAASRKGYITASGNGSFAWGFTKADTDATVKVEATGQGAFASGSVSGGSTIIASNTGAVAIGSGISGGDILSSAAGAGAMGLANTNNITASAAGAFARGSSTSGAIIASAVNAVQFGVGTNSTANSLQVGSQISLRDTGTIWLLEQAAEDDATATWGKIWVRNSAPNVLMFTDDTGADFTVDVTAV